ncbi:MAG TPA: hypothetical protein VGP33_01790 [Chloroflexota bacterium]|nr:hypothetical protein [Chloroflexota bacterium]
MPSQYLTVAELLTAPLGLSLRAAPASGATGPSGVTGQQTYEELTNVIRRASALADTYCQQVLAATSDSEEKWTGSGLAGVDANGYVWVHTDYWPVLAVSSFQYGYPSAGGTTWTAVPPAELILFRERIVYPSRFPQRGQPPLRLQYTYQNGWPNTLLAAPVAAGADALPVADATGLAAGSKVTIFDEGNTEEVGVASAWAAVSGPASVALAAGCLFPHTPIFRPATPPAQPYDIAVSALPADAKQAVLLICKALLETRGANALVMGRTGGVSGSRQLALPAVEKLPLEAQSVLDHYRRLL